MQRLKYVNAIGEEIDFTDFENFGVTEWNGLSETALNVQSQQVPYKDGSVYIDSLYGERELSFTVAMNDGKNLNKRYELKRLVISVLNAKLGQGYLYYSNDFLEKRIKVIPQLPIFPTKNFDNRGTLKFSVSFTACIPYWEDLDTVTSSLIKGNTYIENKGDVPTEVEIKIESVGATNLQIENKTTGKKLIFPSIDYDMRFNLNTGNKNLKKVVYQDKLIENAHLKIVNKFYDMPVFANGLFFYKKNNYEIDVLTKKNEIHQIDIYSLYSFDVRYINNKYYMICAEEDNNKVWVSDNGFEWSLYKTYYSSHIEFIQNGYTYMTTPEGWCYHNVIDGTTEQLSPNFTFLSHYTYNHQKRIVTERRVFSDDWNVLWNGDTQPVSYIIVGETEKYFMSSSGDKIDKETGEVTPFAPEIGGVHTSVDSMYMLPNGMYLLYAFLDKLYICTNPLDTSTWEELENYDGVEFTDYENILKYKISATETPDDYDIISMGETLSDNLISILSPQSDMDFNLQKGMNNIEITADSGELAGAITFRNKYIGV